jgi:hypothetical protein
LPGVEEATVYGVQVEGQDGRAGMASVVVRPDFDIGLFGAGVAERLPAYARPVFLRLQAQIQTTGTFKYRKIDLVREGFDPSQVHEPLYLHEPEQGYVADAGALRADPRRRGSPVDARPPNRSVRPPCDIADQTSIGVKISTDSLAGDPRAIHMMTII